MPSSTPRGVTFHVGVCTEGCGLSWHPDWVALQAEWVERLAQDPGLKAPVERDARLFLRLALVFCGPLGARLQTFGLPRSVGVVCS